MGQDGCICRFSPFGPRLEPKVSTMEDMTRTMDRRVPDESFAFASGVAVVPDDRSGAAASGRPAGIVVGVDGSTQSRTALRWACADARARGCTVTAVAVWHIYPLASPDRVGTSPWWFTTEPGEATRAFLETVVDEVALDYPGVAVEQMVLSGHAAEQLIRLSASADAVVLGATGSDRCARVSLGSTSRAVLEHALSTVVLAR